ncbi:MAG: YceI family protein [Rhodospirillales bacterium]|nr:YceI family protein [Rhodospirillales bacterium]
MAIARVARCALGLALLAAGPARAADGQYFRLDQRFGRIAFTVSNLGLFRARGEFARFVGALTLDPADPADTKIDVTVAADSVRTPWDQETAMLRSADFFDVARYKAIRFVSRAVRAVGSGRYRIDGTLSLRGRSSPIALDAKLVHAARDPGTGRQIDDFVIRGTLSRRAFGMTADPLFIADTVRLAIEARVILDPPHGG